MFEAAEIMMWREHGATEAVCDKCGRRCLVAVGWKAHELTLKVKIDCAIMMGWKVAPKMLCPYCRGLCPACSRKLDHYGRCQNKDCAEHY